MGRGNAKEERQNDKDRGDLAANQHHSRRQGKTIERSTDKKGAKSDQERRQKAEDVGRERPQ